MSSATYESSAAGMRRRETWIYVAYSLNITNATDKECTFLSQCYVAKEKNEEWCLSSSLPFRRITMCSDSFRVIRVDQFWPSRSDRISGSRRRLSLVLSLFQIAKIRIIDTTTGYLCLRKYFPFVVIILSPTVCAFSLPGLTNRGGKKSPSSSKSPSVER